MAKRIYDSPGVYTSEKEIMFSTETIGVTTLGVVGETTKGAAFQPVFNRNYDEFRVNFGGTNPEKFKGTQIPKYELPYIAKSYLTQSNQLFVTRVLGLSGYNAGDAFVLRTLGSCDEDSLEFTRVPVTGSTAINFTGSISTGEFVTSGDLLIDAVSIETGIDKEKFEDSFNAFFDTTNHTTKPWFVGDAFIWGIIDQEDYDDTIEPSVQGEFDGYQLPFNIPPQNKNSYILNNEFTFDEGDDKYNGIGFVFFVSSNNVVGDVITGELSLVKYEIEGDPVLEYHKKTAAVLRSRGSYLNDNMHFYVDPLTVEMDNESGIIGNPLGTFDIIGETTGSTEFRYTVSLDKNSKNYIKNVLGTSAFDKEPFLFVEEVYDASIMLGWNEGKIKGLYDEVLIKTDWNHYKFQYQTPSTPFFVSELRGGKPERLFKLISISDGNSGNTEIKVSITDIDLVRRTFNLSIRNFNDTDKNPVVLERYLNLSMNESDRNYIGKRIGTIDNKYPLRSSYVFVEMAENAPSEAIPAGFEGYEVRHEGIDPNDADFIGVPRIPYKTKYYNAGDVISTPPTSLPITSNGDRVRRAYLGFSDLHYGWDTDLLKFKGKVGGNYNEGDSWTVKTKGFHMDIFASELVDSYGNNVFESGIASFSNPNDLVNPDHAYNDIRTRKYTALFAGGFDGWDIYRKTRTNTDAYRIGRNGFVNGGFETFSTMEYRDEIFGTSDYYAYLLAAKVYQNADLTTINILATPGIDVINNTDLVRDIFEIIEEIRLDSIYLPTLPDIKLYDNTTPTNVEDWYYPEELSEMLDATEIDSNYGAVYYPWIQVSDTENNANIFIPPTAEVVKTLAYTDNIRHPWYSNAGYGRGVVQGRARVAVDQIMRDILYSNRINPIATFADVGTTVWGNKNLQMLESPLDRLNIRRLLLQARKLIIEVGKRLLFEPNDEQVRSEFLALVNPILDNIRNERGLSDFRVKLDPVAADDDRNTLRGKIGIKPIDTLEFIDLEFVVTPTSVSFDDI